MMALVVDDDVVLRGEVRSLIEAIGMCVDETSDAESALNLIESNDYELVVIDDVLDGIGGYQLCRTIRKIVDAPIVILSSYRDETNEIIGLESGADDFIAKPFSMSVLSCRLRAVLKCWERAKLRYSSISE